MQKLLSKFLRTPSDFFLDQRRQRFLIISLFSLLFVCSLFFMANRATRQRQAAADPNTSPTPTVPAPTQTKWWVRHEPSETPIGLILSEQRPVGATEALEVSIKCPIYASDFKPGTFAYISLSPPYENLLRSGGGKNYSIVGFIEIGGWLRILAEPICDDSGYVWLNVQSAAGSSNWTAGGHKTAQWVIPCPDPNRKCSKKKQTGSNPATPSPNENSINNNGSNNPNVCVSDKLAIGLYVQVSPNDLLVVRSEPLTGSVLGRIAPLAVIEVIDGPICAGGSVWWKVWGPQTGWAVENNLRACPKEGDCDPWNDEQVLH
jgi:hypothetical protein